MIFIMLCSLFVKAQSASGNNARSLKANFSVPALLAYQETAKTKIRDFYQYLELLSDASLSKQLKEEVKLNILSLFKNKDVMVKDITSNELNDIQLPLLLSRLAAGPSLNLKIGSINDQSIEQNSWLITYSVKVVGGAKENDFKLTQRIYLIKNSKTFGANSKDVWQLFLGETQ